MPVFHDSAKSNARTYHVTPLAGLMDRPAGILLRADHRLNISERRQRSLAVRDEQDRHRDWPRSTGVVSFSLCEPTIDA